MKPLRSHALGTRPSIRNDCAFLRIPAVHFLVSASPPTMLRLTILLFVFSATLIAAEGDSWWKLRDDRLSVVEDIHSKVLKEYPLDGGFTLGFNRCEDAS